MKYIYGCKMFRSSSRKDHIRANIANPINVELVQQIQDLTDDEDTLTNSPSEGSSANNKERKILKGPSSSPSGGSYSPSFNDNSEPSDEDIFIPDDETNNDSIDSEKIDESPESDDNVDDGSSDDEVESSEEITAVVEDELDINQLKSILNNSSLTYGVSRISERKNEVWVYYNDDINLNPMLSDIIYSVESSKFKNLEFNRIARSDNAVVFEKVDNDG